MGNSEEILSGGERKLPPEDLIEIGKRLKKRREAHGWKQKELAEMVDVNDGTISKLESGKGQFSLPLFKKLVAALETDYNYIMAGDVTSSSLGIPEQIIQIFEICNVNDCEFINRMCVLAYEYSEKVREEGNKKT